MCIVPLNLPVNIIHHYKCVYYHFSGFVSSFQQISEIEKLKFKVP